MNIRIPKIDYNIKYKEHIDDFICPEEIVEFNKVWIERDFYGNQKSVVEREKNDKEVPSDLVRMVELDDISSVHL